MAKKDKEEKDRVKQDHERLQNAVEELRSQRQFILDCISDSRFAKILNRYEKEIESEKEALVMAEKKEIDGLQASVKARRALIATLKGSYENDLEEAARQLREFELHNQLFLQGAKPEAVESKEAAGA